ncbi:alpha/beta hydrolase [Clostridium carnis]
MSKKNKIIRWIVAIILIVFLSLTYIVGGMVYNGSVGSSPEVDKDSMIEVYSSREDKLLDKLEKYNSEKTFVKSSINGYDVEVLNIKSNKKTENAIVLVHGIESNYYEVLNSAFNYLENGYNVVVYNQRQTGQTGGKEFTMGLYERFDLDEVVNYAKKYYPNGKLGVHGYSMGAATATMHTELNEKNKNVDFYILDAPYDTMESAIRLGIIKKNIPLIPVGYAAWAGDLYIKLKSGFSFDDVKPYKSVENISVPVMLIHGTADKTTSPEGSKHIYDTIPHDKKELWLIDGLGHCVADNEMEDEYFNRIYNFIEKNVK